MKKEEVLIQTDNVKVRVMEMPPGEATPLHHHTEVTDHLVGLTGEIIILLQGPAAQVVLTPGVRCTVAPGRRHRVANRSHVSPATYLLIQGVGPYDFIAEES